MFALPLMLARRSRISASASVGRTALLSCMLPRSSALAKARPTSPMSSASRSAWRRPSNRFRGGRFVVHVQALPGNPYDWPHASQSSSLRSSAPSALASSASSLTPGTRVTTHRKHQRFRVYVAGQKRRLTAAIKRALAQALGRRAHHRSPQRRASHRPQLSRPCELAMRSTPCSLPSATTSAASSGGSLSCCASSWPSSQRRATRAGPS